MSMTDPYSDLDVADPAMDGSNSAAGIRRRHAITGALDNQVLIMGERLALEEFIVRVLRRAHQAIEPVRSPGEHRGVWRVAHLFADELERTDPAFDRVRFMKAVAQDHGHA
jgi:hypothetical protein